MPMDDPMRRYRELGVQLIRATDAICAVLPVWTRRMCRGAPRAPSIPDVKPDPEHPVTDWKSEVNNSDTRQGYEAWVLGRKGNPVAQVSTGPWNPWSHWDDHPCYLPKDWMVEVDNDETRQGYVAWVNSQIYRQIDHASAP